MHRIGMHLSQIRRNKFCPNPFLLRQLISAFEPFIIIPDPLYSCKKRFIGSMAGIGFRKGSVHIENRLFNLFPAQMPGKQSQPGRPCRVAAGRSDHNRPYHVKNTIMLHCKYLLLPPLAFCIPISHKKPCKPVISCRAPLSLLLEYFAYIILFRSITCPAFLFFCHTGQSFCPK